MDRPPWRQGRCGGAQCGFLAAAKVRFGPGVQQGLGLTEHEDGTGTGCEERWVRRWDTYQDWDFPELSTEEGRWLPRKVGGPGRG